MQFSFIRFVLHVSVTICLFQAAYAQNPAPEVYSWSPAGPLALARHSACVAALDDGRGMVSGGEGTTGALNSVEMYESDGTFLPGQPLLHARSNHTCTVLNDGRVLVAGGKSTDGAAPAEIYDPETDAWTDLETPGVQRWNQSATLLSDGSVLLAGGDTVTGASKDLEIFNPLTDRITLIPATLSVARTGHAAALLPDGRVLLTGGSEGTQLLSSVDVYHPDGTVTSKLNLPEPRAGHSATILADGRVLIAGGLSTDGELTSALLFSANDNVFHAAGLMGAARSRHLAFLIPGNGAVLIAGGEAAGVPTASTELFDPETSTFTAAGPLTAARRNLSGAALNQPGVLLAVGGLTADGPLAACGTFLAPTITLDKSLYVQGDNITVSGANWPGGITLTVNTVVRTFSGTIATNTSLPVKVTSSGSFQTANALPAALGVETSGGHITASTFATINVNGSVQNFHANAGADQLNLTTTFLSASAEKIQTLDKVTLKANVKLGVPMPLQGFVTFFDGRAVVGVANTTATPSGTPGAPTPGSTFTFDANGNNIFTVPNVTLSAGTRTVQALFTPSSSLIRTSSDSGQIQVDKRQTTLAFAANALSNVKVGETITLTAIVKPTTTSPTPPALPTGTVLVFRDPVNSFISVPVSPNITSVSSNGNKPIAAGPAGTVTFAASYQGDDNYQASAVVSVAVAIAKGQVTFSATPRPVTTTAGALVNLTTAIQHPPAPGAPATGTITVVNGPANFSGNNVTVSPDFNDGSAVNTTVQTFLQDAGSKSIQLHYSGNDSYLPADILIPATVNKITPAISISSFNPICCQVPFTFRVDVNPPGSLFLPKAPTGLFDTLAPGIGELGLLGDCVLSANTTGHGAGCNPQAGLISPELLRCSITLDFTFTYHGDSNYNSQQIVITKDVPLNANMCKAMPPPLIRQGR